MEYDSLLPNKKREESAVYCLRKVFNSKKIALTCANIPGKMRALVSGYVY